MRRILIMLMASVSLLLTPLQGSAKLAPTQFTDLVSKSDLIVFARTKNIFDYEVQIKQGSNIDEPSGGAILTITEVVKGEAKEKEITLRWSLEVHDQHIKPGEYILFLRKVGETYKATYYGRSYWRILTENKKSYVVYQYPLTFAEVADRSVLKPGPKGEKSVIFINDLLSLINQIIGTKAQQDAPPDARNDGARR